MNVKYQKPVALLLFLLSGLVSLVFQVVWLKMLLLVFGNTVWAVSTLLTAFMAGLALGSWLFGRIADRTDSPLRLYGLLEGFIGLYGLLTPFLLSKLSILYIPLYSLTGGDNFLMGILKFILGFLILLPPTICMGGTLPLLAKRVTTNIKTAGTSIGSLYTINTLGAVLGTFFTGFFLIPILGLRITVIAVSMINFAILIIAFLLTKGEKVKFGTKQLLSFKIKSFENKYILWIYLFCGFTALAYEVTWNRILVLHIGSSVYAYSVMLAVYLLGIALGSAIMSYLVKKIERPILIFSVIQLAIAFDYILILKQYGNLSSTMSHLGDLIGTSTYSSFIISITLSTLQVIILPTVLFGACFPLAVRIFVKDRKKVGNETGVLYSFNTIGTIFGSFITGFILLPLIGVQPGMLVIASINLLIGLYLLFKEKISIPKKMITAGLVIILLYGGSFLLTSRNEAVLSAGVFKDDENSSVQILSFEEDIYATVTVEERMDVRGTWRSLSMNGVNVAGTSSELFTIQKFQGHLPLLLHKNPKSVLHIGFGSGGTAWSVSRYPVDKIKIAEISPSIIKKASKYFKQVNHDVLKDPRVEVVYTDGRNLVLASEEKYDVILSDSIHPRFSGNGSLYTYDYYKLLRNRLNPGGLVSQWLPFYSITNENFKMILKSFCEVFPNTSVWYINSTINSYVIVIGKLDGPYINYPDFASRFEIPEVASDLREINSDSPFKILDFFFFANEHVKDYVKDIPLHTDDNMAVEYLSGRALSKFLTSYINYVSLLKYRTSVIPYLKGLDSADESRGDIIDTIKRYETATYYNLSGQLLINQNKREEAFRYFEMIRIYNPEDLEPVEYFGASYQRAFLTRARLRIN